MYILSIYTGIIGYNHKNDAYIEGVRAVCGQAYIQYVISGQCELGVVYECRNGQVLVADMAQFHDHNENDDE